MSYRILIGIIGIAVALICGALTQLGKPSIVVQAGLLLGMATAFVGFGLESIHEAGESGVTEGRKGKRFRGWVFIVVGVGLVALTVTNLLRMH